MQQTSKPTDHGTSVGTYFDKAATTWDTFYDHKRSALMRWVDQKFRSDVFNRYRLTFEEISDCTGKTLLDVGCGSGPIASKPPKRVPSGLSESIWPPV